jgi:hypothetical protein
MVLIFQRRNYDAELCNIGAYVDEGTMVDTGQQWEVVLKL